MSRVAVTEDLSPPGGPSAATVQKSRLDRDFLHGVINI